MTPTDQFIRGFERAMAIKCVTKAKVCRESGVSPMTLRRFMYKRTDIKLMTLARLCEDGLDMTFQTVFGMGGE